MDGVKQFFVPKENLHELIVVVIASQQPPLHMSCDWLRDPLALGMFVMPICERKN